MAFTSLILFLLAVYLRPGEIIPAWRGFPIAYVVLPICALLTGLGLIFRRDFAPVRADLYAVLFLVVAMISTIVNGWSGGVLMVLTTLGPSIIGYFVTRCAVGSIPSLERAGRLIVLLSAFLAGNGLLQYYTGHGLGDVQALTVSAVTPDAQPDEESDAETRIRGTGIFNDPNDLAFALVIGAPLTFWLWRSTRGVLKKSLSLAALGTIVYAIALTRSRGGLLGLALGLAPLLNRHFGRKTQIAALALGGLIFAATASGRMSTFNASEASAQGRIEAWSAGLQMLKTHPVFGVGFGNFLEYHELVAHNSYIHTLAELGLVGGFAFVSLVGLFLLAWRGLPKDASGDASAAWLAGGTGALMCCVFISRQYSAPLFMVFAIGGSIAAIRQLPHPWWLEPVFGVATVVLVGAVYVAVGALGAW